MNRRDFLRHGARAAATLGVAGIPRELLAASKRMHAHDRVPLGRTGLTVSRLAQGTGTQGFGGSSNQLRQLGVDGLADLLHAGYDAGLNLWDCADSYGSHAAAARALRHVKRQRVVLLTKTHATTEAEMTADLDRFRRELDTDVIDIVLLHGVTDADWPARKAGAMAALTAARERGVVRAVGVSCHSLAALKASAATPWVQVQLARFNLLGTHMDAPPEVVAPILKEMRAAGRGVLGMKVLALGDLRDRVDDALRHALDSDALDAFTIGCESRAELADLLKRIPAVSGRG